MKACKSKFKTSEKSTEPAPIAILLIIIHKKVDPCPLQIVFWFIKDTSSGLPWWHSG